MTLRPCYLSDVEAAYKRAAKIATPHRNPNFKNIRILAVPGDPEVRGRMWFIEEHNTGYDGLLFRWQFFVDSPMGSPVEFWADLLPDAIATAPTSDAQSPEPAA